MSRVFLLIAAMASASGCAHDVPPAAPIHALLQPVPDTCPNCHGRTVRAGAVGDDLSKPSVNLVLWNRSICGNGLYGADTPYCPRCRYAYSNHYLGYWVLSTEDPHSFPHRLHQAFIHLPLPALPDVRSRVVYTQELRPDGRHESVAFWCRNVGAYLTKLESYAEANSLFLIARPGRGDMSDEVFVTASVGRRAGSTKSHGMATVD